LGSIIDKKFSEFFSPLLPLLKINPKKKSICYIKNEAGEFLENKESAYRYNKSFSKLKPRYDPERNIVEGRKKDLEKILKKHNKKYEEINKMDYLEEEFQFIFYKDENFYKGLIKIVTGYAASFDEIEYGDLESSIDYSTQKIQYTKNILPDTLSFTRGNKSEDDEMSNFMPYHALSLFNIENYLIGYINLFDTFQYYVILSEKYDNKTKGNIEKNYACGVNGEKLDEKKVFDNKLSNKKIYIENEKIFCKCADYSEYIKTRREERLQLYMNFLNNHPNDFEVEYHLLEFQKPFNKTFNEIEDILEFGIFNSIHPFIFFQTKMPNNRNKC
jgi:hypothetical protein